MAKFHYGTHYSNSAMVLHYLGQMLYNFFYVVIDKYSKLERIFTDEAYKLTFKMSKL